MKFRQAVQYSVAAIILVSALGMSGCASTGASQAQPTAAAVVQHNAELTTFNALVVDAGMQEKLSGDVTVFAPTNAAFAALPAGALDKLRGDKAALANAISYHIVPKAVLAADLPESGTLVSMQGGKLSVSKAGTFVTVDESLVVTADQKGTNAGVVHIIDRVLVAPKK